MKAWKCLFFATICFGVLATAKAQTGMPDSFPLVPSSSIPDRPSPPMVPAHVANPRFPLQVQVLSARWKYNGNHEYKGAGILALVGQSTQDIAYHYRCVNSFEASDTYQARWVKPGQTLEILMSGPRSHHTNTCRLDTHS